MGTSFGVFWLVSWVHCIKAGFAVTETVRLIEPERKSLTWETDWALTRYSSTRCHTGPNCSSTHLRAETSLGCVCSPGSFSFLLVETQ